MDWLFSEGIFFGYPILVCCIFWFITKRRINDLTRQFRNLQKGIAPPPTAAYKPTTTVMPTPLHEPLIAVPKPVVPKAEPAVSQSEPSHAATEPVSTNPLIAWLTARLMWLFKGNVVAKCGLLILFIGMSFLVKYMAQYVTLPIELRLTGIVLGALALLVWGWRLRFQRRDLSLPIQGTALAILMLVTFGAMRLYQLIPASLAMGLLLILLIFTCLLAILQDAMWLAVFGIVGGFAVPPLMATGDANPQLLFSYYALLNVGILAIALLRAWRWLNLLGFGLTFTIGLAWGVRYYSASEHYPTIQGFLLLFFLLYVAITVLYAARQDTQGKNYVDAKLLFGTPLVTFSLQLALLPEMQFGHAFSALGFGIFYAALALILWRWRQQRFTLLVEASLALGVIFATLVLPFALSSSWTAAAWAMEGCGLLWIGLRQRQPLTWMSGLLVQAGAWLALIDSLSGQSTLVEANLWLFVMLLAAGVFFMISHVRQQYQARPDYRWLLLAVCALAIVVFWLPNSTWVESIAITSATFKINLFLASGGALVLVLGLLVWYLPPAVAFALGVCAAGLAGLALLGRFITVWPWSTPANSLFEPALFGALIIAASAGVSSWIVSRLPAAYALRVPLTRALLLASFLWYFGPCLNGVSGYLMLLLHSSGISPDATWWSSYVVCLAISALCWAQLARRLAWNQLRWFSATPWFVLPFASVVILLQLYDGHRMPRNFSWIAYLALWLTSEYLMHFWPRQGWRLSPLAQRGLHLVRSAGPWAMLWKAGALWLWVWYGVTPEQSLLAEGGWRFSASWAHYIPAWAAIMLILWLGQRSRREQWPVAPVAQWYRQVFIPGATACSVLVMLVWNFLNDGSMAPLPYLPLLNPLDLSSAFALLLGVVCYRMLRVEQTNLSASVVHGIARLPIVATCGVYLWLNLMLLRSAAHWLDIDYRFDALFAAQSVQAMLSLLWSVTALLLMRWASQHARRRQWRIGAGLLLLVLVKLTLVDLTSVGSVARIVSFVGVGLLMLLIGYLAPFPDAPEAQPGTLTRPS